jgi:cytochrome c
VYDLEVDKSSGQAPLKITASLDAEDLEGDAVEYIWNLGNGDSLVTQTATLDYTYTGAGEFLLSGRAVDASGNRSEALQQTLYVGNSRPEVVISTKGGNESFFVPGLPVNYEVQILDEGEVISPAAGTYYVSVDYREGLDEASLNRGHQQASALISGKALTQSLDCKSCHKEKEPSIGPSYMMVSQKYQEGRRNTNMRYLVEKIAQGGGGVWGEVMMPAHPNVSLAERQEIATYILSLADTSERAATLPLEGAIQPDPNQTGSNMVITATYTDEGMNGVKALTGTAVLALKSNRISPSEDMDLKGMQAMSFGGMDLALLNAGEGSLKLENYDLSGVNMILLMAAWQTPPAAGCDFELHLGSVDGKLVGSGQMNTPQSGQGTGIAVVLSEKLSGKQTIYLTYKRQNSGSDDPGMLALTGIQFQ